MRRHRHCGTKTLHDRHSFEVTTTSYETFEFECDGNAGGAWVVRYSDGSGIIYVFEGSPDGELEARRCAMTYHMDCEFIAFGDPEERTDNE